MDWAIGLKLAHIFIPVLIQLHVVYSSISQQDHIWYE